MSVNTVFIELTNTCNCKCASCPHSVYGQELKVGAPFVRSKGFMDFGLFEKTLEQAWRITKTVNFSFFGEPMLHPRFLDILDLLKRRSGKQRFVIFTNFTFATQEILDKLIETRTNNMRISLDSATADTFDVIRAGTRVKHLNGSWMKDGERRFDVVTSKVERWFSMPCHTSTRHEFVVSSRNRHEVKPFMARWLPRLGRGDTIFTKSICSYGGTMLKDTFLNRAPCRIWGVENYLVVDWQGNVSPCNLDTNMDLKIGDINKQTLAEIHRGPEHREVERGSKLRQIKPCDTCVDGNNRNRDQKFRRGAKWNESMLKKHQPGPTISLPVVG